MSFGNKRPMFRDGYMRFVRLGPIKFTEQSRWGHAPAPKGLWAFPYPYFDMFFAYHKYEDLLPKRFHLLQGSYLPMSPIWYVDNHGKTVSTVKYITDNSGTYLPEGLNVMDNFWVEREAWINNIGKKILPLREFWYRGDLFSHFAPDGSIGATSPVAGDSVDWFRTDVGNFHKFTKLNSGKGFAGAYFADGKRSFTNYTTDHLEVFIPPNMGQVRSGKSPHK